MLQRWKIGSLCASFAYLGYGESDGKVLENWRDEMRGRQNMHIVWFERAAKLGGTLKSYLTFPYCRGDIVLVGFWLALK